MGKLDPALKTNYRGGTSDDVEAELDSYMLCTLCGQVYDMRAPAESTYHSRAHGAHDPVDDSEFSPRELEKRRSFAPLLARQAPAARADHNDVRGWHDDRGPQDRPA